MADRILTADELIRELKRYNHRELHVHHTWKPEHKNFNGKNHLALQQGMRNYHKNNLRWQDIGQHVTLMPDGKFVTGRPFHMIPASIKGYNSRGFAVEMLGNFDIGHDKLEGEQKKAILKLAKWFDSRGRYIRFHRENAAKTCPGTSIDKTQFMREVRGQAPIKNTPNVSKANSTTKERTNQNKPKTSSNPVWKNYIVGKEVEELQRELNKQFNAGIKVDGYFGQATIDALINVKKGAKGNITKIIQKRLTALGYRINVDSIFGRDTENAIKSLQKANGLSSDGIVDKNTWRLLFKKNATTTNKKVITNTTDKVWRSYINGQLVKDLQTELNKQFNKGIKVDGWFGQDTINALVTVKKGAKGNLTRIIQKRLIAKGYKLDYGVDGNFGNSTYKVIIKLQQDNNLVADGIVGKETWKALFRK